LLVEQTNALCHCRDCVGFVQALDKSLVQNGATHLVQFYKSDIKVVKGKDSIESVRLRKGSHVVRCYCKKCKTPLGMDIAAGPVSLLMAQLIQEPYPIFLPSLVLNLRSAEPGQRPYGRETSVRQGLFAPWFMIRVVARVLLGFFFGKGQGGLLQNDYSKASIGLKYLEQ
jgi:hypothetical protein